jgi:hypothetical protein
MPPRVLGFSGFLLLGVVTSGHAQHFPWAAKDAPPSVAGVHLHDKRPQLDAALGTPDQVTDIRPGFQLLTYTSRGVAVLYPAPSGAETIYLKTAEAGSLGGIKVGDARSTVLSKWGPPTQTQGPNAVYLVGVEWNIVVQYDPSGKRVLQLALGITG